MELRHLRYFAAVADTLNFRAAAERLHLSTPALSKQIKNLEEELGVGLLERTTTHVRMTPAGTVFLPEARRILEQAELAMQLARAAAKGERGRLSVGNMGPLTASFMAACLTAYCARYPDVEVNLIDLDLPSQRHSLERREIHVGFVPALLVPDLPEGFSHLAVLTTPLAAVVSAQHPLAAERVISFAQLARERVLCISGGATPNTHRGYITELMRNRGLKPSRIVEVQGYESLLAMVAGGQGVSIIGGRSGLLHVDGIAIRPLKETGEDTLLELHAVWRPDTGGRMAENFITEFRRVSHARQEAAPVASAARRRAKG